MSNKVIDINNVCFHYQEQKNASLTHVNLQINEGEVVVLCGESGCGKSTIIRLINGLIPYYYKGRMDGQVKVLGHLTQEGKSNGFHRERKRGYIRSTDCSGRRDSCTGNQ